MSRTSVASDKTLAMRLLDGKKVAYVALRYDPDVHVSALEVAHATGMPLAQVFKTLVSQPDAGKPILAVVPANAELDLKALAQAVCAKKVRMVTQADAERLTGLQKGGISALALVNKGFRVVLHSSAPEFPQIAMSAGQRGVQVALAPQDFARVTGARLAPIAGQETRE